MISYIKHRISAKFFLLSTVFIITVFAVLFFWLSNRQKMLILGQVEKQAIILHRQIVLTRQWVSNHNYIWVAAGDKNAGDHSNKVSLDHIGGKVYTRITPAGLTRQLSEIASRNHLYSFNLTNFNGINPDNIPDGFESQAIMAFRSGRFNALSRIEEVEGRSVFRYAAPLMVQQSCLKCHDSPDFKIGGIGGCISVLIPIEETQAAIRADNYSLFFGMAGLTASLILVLFVFAQRLIFNPIREIQDVTSRIKAESFEGEGFSAGDELSEFTGLCYLMDRKLKNHHRELALKIQEATRDLHRTNTELADANTQLLAMNRAKSEFFTDISHELRTPLTAIKGAVDLLTRKGACTETHYIDIIHKNTAHLTHTIMDFLDYSKIEFGRLELEFSRHSLKDIVKEVITAQAAMAHEKGIQIEFQDRGSRPARVDRYRIYQVVSNLLVNALKFSPSYEAVVIKTWQFNGEVLFTIADKGPGIAPEHQEAIFQKFYKAPTTTVRNRGGSGIGLAICKGLVEGHGGKVWVESRLGHGSTFGFKLPTDTPPPTAGGD